VGRDAIGAAWSKRSEEGRDYLSLKLDDPSLRRSRSTPWLDAEAGQGGDYETGLHRAPCELGRAFLGVLTAATLACATAAVPNFATAFNISQAIADMSERALIVLPMVLLIIAREIDLSVASMLALGSVAHYPGDHVGNVLDIGGLQLRLAVSE
jgi:hypothetical protein